MTTVKNAVFIGLQLENCCFKKRKLNGPFLWMEFIKKGPLSFTKDCSLKASATLWRQFTFYH